MADKCPVDHSSVSQQTCPVPHPTTSSGADTCPVDHTARSTWSSILPHSSDTLTANAPTPAPSLSTSRETSSIPRNDSEKWVYPSEAQFFAAMARKNHNPQATDMKVVVPIHNAVNERAWGQILGWEAGRGSDACGGVQLISFKGRPRDMSPRARFKTLMGPAPGASNVSFFLDVRPALDSWEGVKMRAGRFVDRWAGSLFQSITTPSPAPSQPPTKADS
ncbi:hypothetical protein EW146_g6628 [Bondarzewia mesenterica]|uniref:Holocytochrome c-type synthase n=1 Tax=Bondarzewia mesenterica TaxID=1095465 RepID=A0A4S4LMZ7_9AGAM|nr:hypothetical protein EW146_g6628 [Bondarzewia mesenterica]